MNDDRLTLVATDAADLATLSALMQDAIVRAGDVAWDKRARRLVLLASRYRWEAPEKQRNRCGVRLESVVSVQQQNWPRDPDTALDLLAMTATQDTITIAFAGAVNIRLTVECIDAVVEDMSPAWAVRHRPDHG